LSTFLVALDIALLHAPVRDFSISVLPQLSISLPLPALPLLSILPPVFPLPPVLSV